MRQAADVLRRHHALLRVAAQWAAGVCDAVTGLQVLNASAHFQHLASGFHAQVQGQIVRVQARAVIDVNEVHTDRVVANAHLPCLHRADRQINDLHDFGTAELLNLHGFDHG